MPAELGGSRLSLGVGHHFLAADDLRFGLKPVVEVAPVRATARLKEFIRAEADSFFQRPNISIPTGWFGTLVIDLGFAAGFLAPVEPLGVALQPFRFGVFLCHMHGLLNHRSELVCDRRHGGGDLRMRVGRLSSVEGAENLRLCSQPIFQFAPLGVSALLVNSVHMELPIGPQCNDEVRQDSGGIDRLK